jgi:hypothetical protein
MPVQTVTENKQRQVECAMFGQTKEDNGIWRIETNKELDEPIKQRNVINYVKAQTFSWFGHTNRMSEISIVKKIYKWKPLISRPVGRHQYTSRKAHVLMGR